jgi:hypothetical protein
VRHDTVEGAVVARDVTFDSTLNGAHVAGSADCLTGEVNLFAEIKDTVKVNTISHDTLVSTETTFVESKNSSLYLSAFGESDVLAGLDIRNSTFGLTGSLTISNLSFYVQPQYDVTYGLQFMVGCTVTLWEK